VLVGDQIETDISGACLRGVKIRMQTGHCCDRQFSRADTSALTYTSPFERGIITDWDSQGAVLHRVASMLDTSLPGSHLTCTLPSLTPARQQELAWESIFEAHSVASAAFVPPPLAAALLAEGVPVPPSLPGYGAPVRVQGGFTGLVVDAGHSTITVTPIILGVPHTSAVKRTNVGGKAVANALAAAVSKRQVDLLTTPLAVRRMLQHTVFVHPTGGARLLQDAAVADLCATPGASATLRSAYLRHVAPSRKGTCSELESVTWASASVRKLVSSASAQTQASSGGTRSDTVAAAAAQPSSAKRRRGGAQDAHKNTASPNYNSNNALLNFVPEDLRDMGWLGGLKAGSEEHTAFDALARQQLLGQAVLQHDVWGDIAWGHSAAPPAHPLLDDGSGLGVVREWVLPDGVAVQRGYVKGGAGDAFAAHRNSQLCHEWLGVADSLSASSLQSEGGGDQQAEAPPSDDGLTSVTLASERFMPCEMLFRPDAVGVLQGGAAAAVVAAVGAAPAEWAPALWGNVAVVGGLACIPGMVARLHREVRAAAPADAHVAVWRVPAPESAAMRGLMWLGAQPLRARVAVSREFYEEVGAGRVAEAAAQLWLSNGAPHLGATARMSVDGGMAAAPTLLQAAATATV